MATRVFRSQASACRYGSAVDRADFQKSVGCSPRVHDISRQEPSVARFKLSHHSPRPMQEKLCAHLNAVGARCRLRRELVESSSPIWPLSPRLDKIVTVRSRAASRFLYTVPHESCPRYWRNRDRRPPASPSTSGWGRASPRNGAQPGRRSTATTDRGSSRRSHPSRKP
jgi:hypothetical protein